MLCCLIMLETFLSEGARAIVIYLHIVFQYYGNEFLDLDGTVLAMKT